MPCCSFTALAVDHGMLHHHWLALCVTLLWCRCARRPLGCGMTQACGLLAPLVAAASRVRLHSRSWHLGLPNTRWGKHLRARKPSCTARVQHAVFCQCSKSAVGGKLRTHLTARLIPVVMVWQVCGCSTHRASAGCLCVATLVRCYRRSHSVHRQPAHTPNAHGTQ